MSKELILKDRREFIHDQVFLTLINDGDWYRRTEKCENDFGKFRRICASSRSANCVDHYLSPEERRFCTLMLYESRFGHPLVSSNIPILYREAFNFYRQVRHEFFGRAYDLPKSNQEESEIMNSSNLSISAPAFETQHFVYGVRIDTLDDSSLIDAIKRLEAEIGDLKSVKTKSTAITKKVKELEDMLGKVVEVLDARASK